MKEKSAIINMSLSPNLRDRKGVVLMLELLFLLFVTIVANVISYYVCKWLDSNRK